MKKVLILANNDVGLYKFRKELIQQLLQTYEVYLSLPQGELVKSLETMGCHFIDTTVDRRGINPLKDLKLLGCYFKMMRKLQPDLVITYTIKPNIYGGFVARCLHIPYALNITGLGTAFQQDNLVRKLVCTMYRVASAQAKVVFFENTANQATFLSLGLIHKKQAYGLNGAGVNLEEYPFTAYPPQSSPLHFLFIGRVMKEKGVDELLEAASRIKADYPDIIFDFVGPMEDDYQDVIASYVAKGIIQYHGYQEDVRPFIQQCHCFVLPSHHEGMANTLLECASMGRPLITSDIHGCKEAISDNGFLCQVQDAQNLYQKLLAFIALPYERKKQMGLNSRKHMEAVFDKKKVVEETLKGLNV